MQLINRGSCAGLSAPAKSSTSRNLLLRQQHQVQRLCSRPQVPPAAAARPDVRAAAAAAPATSQPPAPTVQAPARTTSSGGALTTSGIVYHDPKWLSVENEQQFFSILEVSLS